jgi:hypothetical protein
MMLRGRMAAGLVVLAVGAIAEGVLERSTERPRLPLGGKLATIPLRLGSWVGRDVGVDPRVLRESQADDYVNRIYEDPAHPGLSFRLWINYSREGLNMRHSPEVCLPGHGYAKVEARTRELRVRPAGQPEQTISRLVYAQGEAAQAVGFWYYIFGESGLEQWVRSLPITNRSSHGRTTRGSGLTVEIFAPVETDPDGEAMGEFAGLLIEKLGALMPGERVSYHVP